MKKLSLLLVSAITVCSFATAHANTSKQYYLKSTPTFGSKIQQIDATSPVPFNKRFEELNEQQKELVKAKFKNLNAEDTPPFPKNGLASIYRPIVEANKKLGDNSSLKLTATITRNGTVDQVVVLNSDNDELVAYIEAALRSTRFEPARCSGVACEMDFPIEITFL